jgi:hypothetical protein
MPTYEIAADGSRSRTLLKPIRAHNDTNVTEVKLRPPRYRDVMQLGDPSSLIVMEGGLLPHSDMTEQTPSSPSKS